MAASESGNGDIPRFVEMEGLLYPVKGICPCMLGNLASEVLNLQNLVFN